MKEKVTVDYLKDFIILQVKTNKIHRAHLIVWIVQDGNKVKKFGFTGHGKTDNEAINDVWDFFLENIDIKNRKVKDTKGIWHKFISIAPSMVIPKDFEKYIDFI